MKKLVLPTKIDRFEGSWRFLSNFYDAPVKLDGVEYSTVEHAYQAAKTLDLKKREIFTYPSLTAGQAKRAGMNVKLREDWEEVKLSIMEDLLIQKFSFSILKRKLLGTFQA